INRKGDEFSIGDGKLKLPGEDIKNHLSKSKECLLIAATLGHAVDTRIRYYEKVSMNNAVILDACATAAIEQICDKICIEIQDQLAKDKRLTYRFSPGYGDLPIQIQ